VVIAARRKNIASFPFFTSADEISTARVSSRSRRRGATARRRPPARHVGKAYSDQESSQSRHGGESLRCRAERRFQSKEASCKTVLVRVIAMTRVQLKRESARTAGASRTRQCRPQSIRLRISGLDEAWFASKRYSSRSHDQSQRVSWERGRFRGRSTAATMVSRRRLDHITDRIRDLKSFLYYLLRHFF
jgi:hypothetical protein